MQFLLLAALLVNPALSLVIGNTEQTEGNPGKCASGKSAKWVKRESSKLYEKPTSVKKIYYINLKSEIGRKNHMFTEIKSKAHGIPFERFEATNKKDVPDHAAHPTFKLYSKGRYTPWLEKDAEKKVYAAIHFSNYRVLEQILKDDPKGANSTDLYMVLEDDTQINPQWQKKLDLVVAHTPKEWDMLRIGYWGYARCEDAENDYVYAIQSPSVDKKALGGGHFYSGNTAFVVRPKSIPKILEIMRASSVASIENVYMYPHRMPNGEDKQIQSYAVNEKFMLVTPTGSFESSH